jgi:alpha-galactosidase
MEFRQARRRFVQQIAVSGAALATWPLYSERAAAADVPPGQAGVVQTLASAGAAYVRYDPARQIWSIGNGRIEQQTALTERGYVLQALVDQIGGRAWIGGQSRAQTNDLAVDYGAGLVTGAQVAQTDAGGLPPDPAGRPGRLRLARVEAASPEPDAVELVLWFSDDAAEIEIGQHYLLYDGESALERWIEFVSHKAAAPVRVTRLDSLVFTLPEAGSPWDALTVQYDGHVSQVRLAGTVQATVEGPSAGGPEQMLPLLILRSAGADGGLALGIEWSSDYLLAAAPAPGGITVRGGLRWDDDGGVEIPPGGRVEGPRAFVLCFRGDFSDASREVRRFAAARIAPMSARSVRFPYVTWNSWFAYGRNPTAAEMQRELEAAAALGIEVFYVDYGWFRLSGDWRPDPDKFPGDTLLRLSRRAQELGLKFGLWVDFGEAHPESTLLREHPDFVARQPGEPLRGIDGQLPLCLHAAKEWLKTELVRIVRDYEVDWLKFDQPLIVPCTNPAHGHDTGVSGSLYANTRALYEILAHLRRTYPGLVIENCFNGPGYLDYGVMRYTDTAWLTDEAGNRYVQMADLQRRFAAALCGFPPFYLTQWLAIPLTDSPYITAYNAASTMCGAWGLSLQLTQLSMEQAATLRTLIAAYKRLRPLIRRGTIEFLRQPDRANGWSALEYRAADGQRGALVVVRHAAGSGAPDEPKEAITIPLDSLVPAQVYTVQTEDGTFLGRFTGAQLQNGALQLALPGRGHAVLFYEAEPLQSTLPPAPRLVRVQPLPGGGIQLEWEPVEGAIAYNIYRGVRPTIPLTPANLLVAVDEPRIVLPRAATGVASYFAVTAELPNGQESPALSAGIPAFGTA